ncbi:MAG: HIT family protein [Candidatus Harrisonbacteria bacterium CG10_big_fil_rev_8_21_14_0_10_38_8]|uniref:HIT family protein n=1 Tax=Candidatus Harrisonbacteria bacterium CG10_big_fil_rev_8_21_14_0_10_38_8 TaxID=1974582 RepID=A0A2M6WJR7_9BACT|nr:MAG: HIT family protein [Candidatus Harrisonbacteria bacterium CG10_big_fil_rev_8_21_14_0_10_38_8]
MSIFSKIYNGEIPGYFLYKDEKTMAILDIAPLSIGHTLVIPKEEAAYITDLSDDSVTSLFLTVKKITGILDEAFNPMGFTIGINHKVGQGVDHVHVHIIPRYKGDGAGSIHSVVSYKEEIDVKESYKKIEKYL